MANIEKKVEDCIQSKIEEIGYELYDVEYVKEGKNSFLRIYIDNEKGISLEDCEKVSNEIDETLDKANIISDQYFLEVSSPGVERILRKDKHLESSIGKEVEARLFKKDEKGNKKYIGILEKFNEESVIIDRKEIKRKDVAQLKTVYKWN